MTVYNGMYSNNLDFHALHTMHDFENTTFLCILHITIVPALL